ncbi:MAG: collagen binding domain-containing protein [Nitrososphaerales archaeon]
MFRLWLLWIPLILLAAIASAPSAFSTDTETFLVNIVAVDGLSSEPLSGIVLEILSPSGNVVAREITDDLGRSQFNLPEGDYTIGSSLTIYGFDLDLQSVTVKVDRPTNVDLTISAFLIPVRFLPLAINAGALSIASYLAYRIIRRIRRVPPAVHDTFRSFDELETLRKGIADTAPSDRDRILTRDYFQLASSVGEKYPSIDNMYEKTQKYLNRVYKMD